MLVQEFIYHSSSILSTLGTLRNMHRKMCQTSDGFLLLTEAGIDQQKSASLIMYR